MTEEDDPIRRATRAPEGPGGDVGEGGMTGATGELTPESSGEAFVPAERREASGAEHQADVTAAFHRSGSALVEAGGEVSDEEGPTELAQRESGYGGTHGLAPHDPAYRMERHPSASEAEEAEEGTRPPRPTEGAPRLGGDVRRSPEEEHF
jgi:hypothetical protein